MLSQEKLKGKQGNTYLALEQERMLLNSNGRNEGSKIHCEKLK